MTNKSKKHWLKLGIIFSLLYIAFIIIAPFFVAPLGGAYMMIIPSFPISGAVFKDPLSHFGESLLLGLIQYFTLGTFTGFLTMHTKNIKIPASILTASLITLSIIWIRLFFTKHSSSDLHLNIHISIPTIVIGIIALIAIFKIHNRNKFKNNFKHSTK